jgi:bifunctional non-homologous end joining protein LigD
LEEVANRSRRCALTRRVRAAVLGKADKMAGRTGPVVAGVRISSPDRPVFRQPVITKLELAQYYQTAGPRMVRLAGHRPVSLLRCPEGTTSQCFFQKHAGAGFPDALKQIEITESSGERAPYMYLKTAAGLVGAAQMGTVEFHIWGARTDNLERPDRIVFDLDPDEGLGFAEVKAAADTVRTLLDELGFACTPMVSGVKGVHVIVPLKRTAGWDTVTAFSKTVASVLDAAEPERFVATMAKAKRKGRIFIDWLRNERGSTAIAPYSVRARKGASVAMPVTWAELKTLSAANGFSMTEASLRLKDDCPLIDAMKTPQHLGKATLKRLDRLS